MGLEIGVLHVRRSVLIDASPTPYHAAENVAAQLREDGFQRLEERDAWTLAPGDRRYIIRDAGTLIAFVVAAILTPPDVISQILLAVPVIMLYEISILCAVVIEKRRGDPPAEEVEEEAG